MVLVGAEGVVENGGVINKLGTYQAAVSAHCHNTPFYVAAESYKVFHHLCPVRKSLCLPGPSRCIHIAELILSSISVYEERIVQLFPEVLAHSLCSLPGSIHWGSMTCQLSGNMWILAPSARPL